MGSVDGVISRRVQAIVDDVIRRAYRAVELGVPFEDCATPAATLAALAAPDRPPREVEATCDRCGAVNRWMACSPTAKTNRVPRFCLDHRPRGRAPRKWELISSTRIALGKTPHSPPLGRRG